MEHKTYSLNDGRTINIRTIKPTDSDLIRLFYSSLSESALKWITPLTLAEIKQRFRYPEYFIGLVTIHDEQVVGYGEINKDSKKYDGELNIHIHQDYQGVGLGTAMMIMLVKEATEQLLHGIKLKVAAGNSKAVHLFRKFGFKEEYTTQELYSGEKHDTLHMSKVLNR
jgi:ribosomal protein S18 acetylase RimI-like enzyme